MIGLYFVKNFNMFTQYKILPAPWLVRIPQSEFTSSKNPSVPVKKRLNCLFLSNAAPQCLFFHGSWWVSSMYLLEPGAANSEPHILSKSHDILSAQHPQQISISHTHTPPTQKKCIFALAKPIFTAGVFGDPIPFSRQVLRTLHGSTRAVLITKWASFYNGFAEQPLYNQIV